MTHKNLKQYILRTAMFVLPACGIAGLTSCEDMMTVDTGDKAYVNAQDTLYSYLGVMRAMQDVAERQIIIGEIRGDLVESTLYTTDTLYAISNFEDIKDDKCSMLQISDYYNVINNCNFYIANADTAAVKSNIKYMVPEYAQVKAIRAWAYLQLVKNYKEVPYITEPVKNLNVIERFDHVNNVVNKDNLIDKVIEDGLLDFIDTRYPQYGSSDKEYGEWDNGSVKISAHLCFIPIRIVLGDMYLLRGTSQSDYEKAAGYYFDYLKNEAKPLYSQYCTMAVNPRNGNKSYISYNKWGFGASTYNYNASNNEVISLIPGSANAGFGKMLTRVSDIFGYTPSSSQSSSTSVDNEGNANTDANGNTTSETSGAITVTRNYKRQYGPSNAYQDVVNRQTYVNYTGTNSTNMVATYYRNNDARYGFSVENYTYEGEAYPLCCKAAKGTAFYYTIPLYRKSLIWLRLAEALNRSGYPEFAFAILKDGINQYTLPEIVEKSKYVDRLDEDGNPIPVYNTDGEFIGYEQDEVKYKELDHGAYGAMYYVTDTIMLKAFTSKYPFTDEVWNSTYGIHAKGTGFGTWTSSDEGAISTNISGYRDTVYYDYSKLLLAQGVDIENESTTREDIINAMENIIVDELALETAFEGNRFTDLVRIAEHKNISGYKGTEWLAKKIANRGTKAATEDAAGIDGYDASLFGKLTNTDNWYLPLPSWK